MSAAPDVDEAEYITRQQVLARGWTPAAIKKWLSGPVYEHRSWGNHRYVVYSYELSSVLACEADPVWKKWSDRLTVRRAKKAEEQRRHLIQWERAALRGKPEPEIAARLAAFKMAKPAVVVDLYDALLELTREAKRLRDGSQTAYQRRAFGVATDRSQRKRYLYESKSQAIAHLMGEGALLHVEYHTFESRWALIVSPPDRPEIRLHVPCAPVMGMVPVANLGESIPARPAGEYRAKDAIFSIERYLEGRELLPVYSWPREPRALSVQTCFACGGDWIAGECMDCGRVA
jgi:hypothetical protein